MIRFKDSPSAAVTAGGGQLGAFGRTSTLWWPTADKNVAIKASSHTVFTTAETMSAHLRTTV